MATVDRIRAWIAIGDLEASFEHMVSVLAGTAFTRDRLRNCFEDFAILYDLSLGRELGEDPTLEQFEQGWRIFCKNRTRLMEVCMKLEHDKTLSPEKIRDDFERKLLNRKWQRTDDSPAEDQ
ncbi:hypothetical protein HYZ99_01570 [Candidatus Peregrinibacteria bacterium]|nr:hypothetical protein [Candidatus Peregrinibacteria bacterium]